MGIVYDNKADVECAKPLVSFLAGKIFLRFYTFQIFVIEKIQEALAAFTEAKPDFFERSICRAEIFRAGFSEILRNVILSH